MKTFKLIILDENGSQEFDGVTSFVGEDSTGSFGILGGHARMITSLVIGLARFRCGDDDWHYAAVPSAILYFKDDVLTISTRHCLLDDDYNRISEALERQLLAEEEKLHATKQSLRHMEEEIFRRLWKLGRATA